MLHGVIGGVNTSLQAILETADWRTGNKRSVRDTVRLDEARVIGSRAREKTLGWKFVTGLLCDDSPFLRTGLRGSCDITLPAGSSPSPSQDVLCSGHVPV